MPELLQLRDIAVSFGGLRALDKVSFTVEGGGIHGLIGPNGAGKTTLINVISGLITAGRGRVVFEGRSGPWPMARAVRQGIGRTFQQPRAFMSLTVADNLRIGRVAGASRPGRLTEAELVDMLELGPSLTRRAGELPYGPLRRLGIALALQTGPRLLLLDEPAVGLTAADLAGLTDVLKQLPSHGVSVLLVEHNMRFLMSLAQRVTVLERGRVLFEGSPEECQRNQTVIDVYLGRAHAVA